MANILRDLLHGVRGLGRAPVFAVVSILALAAGIGPNTAIFSILNTVVLRPLPYPEPERMVVLCESAPRGGDNPVAGANYLDWRAQSASFAAMTATTGSSMALAGSEPRQRLPVLRASWGFMEVFGVRPIIGRAFREAEDNPAAEPVALLSHGAWERLFGRDRDIIGRTIGLDGRYFTVIGVLPREFHYIRNFEALIPLALDSGAARDYHYLTVVARLKPGVSEAQARAEMEAIAGNIAQRYPNLKKGWSASLYGLQERLFRGPRSDLPALAGAALFVLLISCANVAGLLLAKATARRHEMAVRAALGAGRRRLVRQLLIESALLALGGGVAGIAAASQILRAIERAVPADALPPGTVFAMDGRALAFTFGLSIVTAVLFGLAPALRVSGNDLMAEIKQGGRGLSGGGARARGALVIGEFALSMVLITGAGLMVRSILRAKTMDPGFDSANVLTMRVDLPDSRYKTGGQMLAFMRGAEERLLSLPGVRAAGFSTQLPMRGWAIGMPFEVAGKAMGEGSQLPAAHFQIVSPDYFRTMGIPLLKGRPFAATDSANAPRVAIVNEVFARRYIGNEEAVGKRVRVQELIPGKRELGPWVEWEVAGVSKAIGVGNLDSLSPEIYVPYAQSPFPAGYLSVRTANDPAAAALSAQAAIDAVDPTVIPSEIRTMEQLRTASFQVPRIVTSLIGGFGALALGLSLMGIYGLMSWLASQRAREIGIRMTLGARPLDVAGLFLRQGLTLAAIGVGAGLAGAVAIARVLRRMLVGVTPGDPLTLLLATLGMTAVAAAACYFPARRAARVDPVTTLRADGG
ncbi:MAG: ABC transporter permease [Bryobacteraceae bacterium]|nr:ABC transporter permease [Bryobacteraceae bacterium]